jgi:hypothetical protein
MNTALIGYTGTVGNILNNQLKFNYFFNSANIQHLNDQQYDIVYCAAPTGNRRWANTNPEKDLKSINSLIKILLDCKTKKLVLISTVDTQIFDSKFYGKHRLKLENAVKDMIDDYCIVRLCSLIDSSIKKNLLYDIKHNQFLDSINPGLYMHWYPMHRISLDIQICIKHNLLETNLVSEPIQNKTIMKNFCPQLQTNTDATSNVYNLVCNNSKLFNGYKNYINSSEEILHYMETYLDH